MGLYITNGVLERRGIRYQRSRKRFVSGRCPFVVDQAEESGDDNIRKDDYEDEGDVESNSEDEAFIDKRFQGWSSRVMYYQISNRRNDLSQVRIVRISTWVNVAGLL